MDTTPSKERLIEGLQSFDEEVDGVPTVREMRNKGPYSPHYYKETFGSWHDALRAADIQPTHGVDPDVDREALIDHLQMVDEETDRPPRSREIDEHGDYPYKVYEDEFGSLIRALEEAGIEPTERQYRFSSVETPDDKKGSENLQILREAGPTLASELPRGTSTKDRQRGVWKFKIDSGSTKPADPIHYLDGDHSPELVIRRFFEKNPHVLTYREPHGIKIAIKNHRPSWKEFGREIVDELYEQRTEPTPEFENLVVVRVHDEEALQYAFESSVDTLVDTEELPITETESTDRRPVWGFSRANVPLWRGLSERDGLLFSTKPGVFTHYVPVAETGENDDVMTELWVEYEDGIRSDGIGEPWPFFVLGEDVREVSIQEAELFDEIDSDLSEDSIQSFDGATLESFSNSYGSFESYLRERERAENPSPNGVDSEANPDLSDDEALDTTRLTRTDSESGATDAGSVSSGEDGDTQTPTESESPSAATDSAMHATRSPSPESVPDSDPNQAGGGLQAQLDRIEAAVTGQQTRAHVVDAGDRVTLLRIVDEQLQDELTHGEVLSVTLNRSVSMPKQDDSTDE